MEGQLEEGSPCRAMVQQVLTQLVQEANQVGSRYAGASGPTIHENEAWDSIMPSQQSIGLSETSGKCSLCTMYAAGRLVLIGTYAESLCRRRCDRTEVLKSPHRLHARLNVQASCSCF